MWMWSTGINRNIVECKVVCWHVVAGACGCVLIETLWNVKHDRPDALDALQRVLIETLWNVKWRNDTQSDGTWGY